MTEGWPHALNQLPPLEERRASLERLGETVKAILASTGMTEDKLVDALTRDDWRSSDNDTDTEPALSHPQQKQRSLSHDSAPSRPTAVRR
jgi:hypothetical protein